MRTLTLTATTRQPLALGTGPTGTAPTETYGYVPGSVVRGALAARWIAEHGAPDALNPDRAEFLALFEGDVAFGPLLANGTDLVPASVRRCKYASCGTVLDAAFTADVPGDCDCGVPLEPAKGGIVPPAGLRKQRTHVQLSEGDTAIKGQLFTRRTLSSSRGGHAFRGAVRLPGDLPAPALAWLQTVTEARLGGRRSTAGQVSVSWSDDAPARLSPSDDVVLVLASPTILTDASGLPLDLTADDTLRAALTEEIGGLLGVAITKVTAWTRDELVGGWHAASGLPKPMERALTVGSVLRLRLAGPATGEAIAAARDRGLGLRRAEGFGHVVVRTGAWTPTPKETPSDEAAPDEVETYVRLLLASDSAAWLAAALRDHAETLAAAAPGLRPTAVLLDRRTYRELSTSVREAVRTLVAQEVQVVDAVQSRLSAELRLREVTEEATR